VDVGWGQLDYKLRNDPRVHVLERTNFRHLDPAVLTERPELAVVDVSFISLDKIFPKILQVLEPGGTVLALVKPQFEGAPREAPGGVVRDEAIRKQILGRVWAMAEKIGFKVLGLLDSTVRGRKGNREAFLYLEKPL
jgi:23S rRNA (cytidine1920-2'-O)/16S rRNA (cytidine1409-2'-O)-methyltransferase